MSTQGGVNKDEIERRVAQFKAAAKDRGIRLTPQRIEIFRAVASDLKHPDAETVHRIVHARMPTVSLDTVYRTLWMLSDMGLVSTLGIRRERVRFDANPKEHHHFVCVQCGATRDFESAELHALRLPDTVRALGSVLSTHIEARGVCENCARKRSRKDSGPVHKRKHQKGQHHG